MGQKLSAIEGETDVELQSMIELLRSKQSDMQTQLQLNLLNPPKPEVHGGRMISLLSEVRVSTTHEPSKQLKAGLKNFFDAASGKKDVREAVVKGAEELLFSTMGALMGVSHGQSREMRSFVVLFMNNAFVRVDYYVYTYAVSAAKSFNEVNKAGMTYVAALSVLDPATMLSHEVDYLLTQALRVKPGDFEHLLQVKLRMVELSVLSRAMKRDDLSADDLSTIAQKIAEVDDEITSALAQLETAEE